MSAPGGISEGTCKDFDGDDSEATAVGANAALNAKATAVGEEAAAYKESTALGSKANALGEQSVAIGSRVEADEDAVAVEAILRRVNSQSPLVRS